MKNNYVFELDWLEFDYDALYRVCTTPPERDSGILPYQRHVDSDPYMKAVQEQYPFLGKLFNIYSVRNSLPVHIDAKRKSVVNIPVRNTSDSSTIWYEMEDKMMTVYDASKVAHIVQNPLKEIYRHTLNVPTLIDVTIPHSVENRSSEPRITISWGISDKIEYEQACRLFLG